MKYFLAYLWITVFVELIGFSLLKSGNAWVYNIYTFFEFNLIGLIYLKLSQEKSTRNVVKLTFIIFNIIYFASFYYKDLQSYTVIIGSFIASVIFMLYLKEFLNSNKLLNYGKTLSFWVTVGLLVYYLGTIPFQTVLKDLLVRDLFNIQILLTFFAHCCFIIGLIWSQKETK
ncbi:hypothetical protein LPB138_12360 [Urechidicola croceus]|uniref:Uncharacterized protein n=2 Tax=Urechidicola croceus TaxID=1850246 RepID=A0A1D8PA34_9FLAO|nr:hypothetical protein LPB138_12360 [Urechidicola croceus]